MLPEQAKKILADKTITPKGKAVKPPKPPAPTKPPPPPPPDTPASIPEKDFTEHQWSFLGEIIAELAARNTEAINLYEPLPKATLFHKSHRPERLVTGSNRSGKTLSAVVEIARAITSQDPFHKYPLASGRCIIVGKDEKHLGETIYRNLCRPGAFRIIRDLETGLWRVYNPSIDAGREDDIRPAPPILPERYILGGYEGIAWKDKKASVPALMRLKNGWEVLFFSSLGKPPQGTIYDVCWFDEEIIDSDWYPEMAMRLVDRGGKFVWSATPQTGTEQLYALHERAEDDDPLIEEWQFLIDENPYIEKWKKDEVFAKLATEEQRRVRYYGEYANTTLRIYPEWSISTHGCDWFEIPADWTNYMVVDPGRQVCAVLFAAVPNPEDDKRAEHHGHVYIWDELYIQAATPQLFAKKAKDLAGNKTFHTFIVDHQGGRVVEQGVGKSIEFQYSEQLRKVGLHSTITGYGFIPGSPDVLGGISAVRTWLAPIDDGKPKLLVFRDKCINLDKEMRSYRWQRNPRGDIIEKPVKKKDHLVDALRYLAQYDPRWVHPKTRKRPGSPAFQAFKLMKKQLQKMLGQGGNSIRLGPGGPA